MDGSGIDSTAHLIMTTPFTEMLDRMRAAEEPRRRITDRLLETETPKRDRIHRLL